MSMRGDMSRKEAPGSTERKGCWPWLLSRDAVRRVAFSHLVAPPAARGTIFPPDPNASSAGPKRRGKTPPMATKPLNSTGTRTSSKKRIRKIFGDIHEVVQLSLIHI